MLMENGGFGKAQRQEMERIVAESAAPAIRVERLHVEIYRNHRKMSVRQRNPECAALQNQPGLLARGQVVEQKRPTRFCGSKNRSLASDRAGGTKANRKQAPFV